MNVLSGLPYLVPPQGISVDETGKQHFLDATVAYKRAVRPELVLHGGVCTPIPCNPHDTMQQLCGLLETWL